MYPPTQLTNESEIVISNIDSIVKSEKMTDVDFADIDFSISKGTGLYFDHARNVHVTGGKVENIGGSEAIRLENATNCTVHGVTIQNCACGGIAIQGGSRQKLIPSGIKVSDNRISHYGNWKRTYMPGILFNGCGHFVSGNTVSNAPHEGITGKCNDCVFDSNHLYDLCFEGVDAGAFYAGRSWAERGNVVKNNVFERIRVRENSTHGYSHVQAIYLDDQMSGYRVVNNTVFDSDTGVLLGGGRDNYLIGNRFIRTDLPLSFDDRGLTWNATGCEKGGKFEIELLAYDYQHPPWSLRYPELLGTYDDKPCTPSHNHIRDLAFCNVPNGASWIKTPGTGIDKLLLSGNTFRRVREIEQMCNTTAENVILADLGGTNNVK